MQFTVTDVGGIKHSIRLSTDPRYPVAMDAAPPGLSRRQPGSGASHDQEGLPPLPDQIDDDTAHVMIAEILKRCGDADEILARVQRGRDYGENDGTDYAPGVTKTPGVGADQPQPFKGMPVPGKGPSAHDHQISPSSFVHGLTSRIRLGGR